MDTFNSQHIPFAEQQCWRSQSFSFGCAAGENKITIVQSVQYGHTHTVACWFERDLVLKCINKRCCTCSWFHTRRSQAAVTHISKCLQKSGQTYFMSLRRMVQKACTRRRNSCTMGIHQYPTGSETQIRMRMQQHVISGNVLMFHLALQCLTPVMVDS